MIADRSPAPRRRTIAARSLWHVLRARLGSAWAVLAAGLLGLGLGGHALIDPDEGRNAAIALAMSRSGDYVVPHLNGLPALDKPALFYAAAALAVRCAGATETAARLPALLAAWATVALTAWFAGRLFGRGTAWVAGLACATAPLAVAMARTAIFDSMLSFFVVLALTAFYLAVESPPGTERPSNERRWAVVAWTAMACGVLTKGPVAVVVPLLVAAPYALWRRRSAVVWHPSGWLLHLLVVIPWVLAVESRVPGFLRYALVTESWRRLTTDELQRGGPLWYFLPVLAGGCLPWILVVVGSGREPWRRARSEEGRALLYLALWIAIPLLFFSLSQSKRPHYVLPLVPAVALLTAYVWCGSPSRHRAARAGAAGWLVTGGLLLAATLGVEDWSRVEPELSRAVASTALAVGVLLAGGGAVAWVCARRRGLALVALSLPVVLLPSVMTPLLVDLARSRSGQDLAAALRPHLTPDTRIVGIETFSPSFTFYLGRPIHLSSATGEPLRTNHLVHSYATWVSLDDSSTLHPAGWWRQALASCSEPTVFLLESRFQADELALQIAGLPVLFTNGRLTAMGPCRPPPPEERVEAPPRPRRRQRWRAPRG